jgi:hypothetical protein
LLTERQFRALFSHPWVPIGIPAAVNLGLFLWLGYGTVFGSGTRVRATLPFPMDGLGAAVLPVGYLDDQAIWGELRVGERFRGQSVRAADDRDVLDGTPSAPLTPAVGEPGLNLYRGDHTIYGANLSGVGPNGVRGSGSLAVWFPRDQSQLGVRFVRASGGRAVVTLYARDGDRLDRLVLEGLENRTYAFQRARGRRDVAGLTVESHDPGNGMGVAEIRFEAVRPILAVGAASRALVFSIPLVGDGDAEDADGLGSYVASALAWYRPGLTAAAAERPAPASAGGARAEASARDAGVFVTGHATRAAGGIRASAALYTPSSLGQPLAVVEAFGADRLGAAEALARRMAVAMAEHAGRIVEADAIVGLPGPAAVRALIEARASLRVGALDDAATRLESADLAGVRHATVEYTRSQIAYMGRQPDQALAAARDALALADVPRTAARIAAWVAYLSGDSGTAAREWGTLSANESDADAWFGLVETLVAAPELARATRPGLLSALAAGLRADRDHVGLIANLVRLALVDHEPEYIDFWTAKARRPGSGPQTRVSLELDLLVAAFRRDDAAFRSLTVDPRLLDPAYRGAVARSLALWAERPDLGLALVSPDRSPGATGEPATLLLLAATGRGDGVAPMLSCLPYRDDGLGPAPDLSGVEPLCGSLDAAGDAIQVDARAPASVFRAAVALEAAGDRAGARDVLDRLRGPAPEVVPWIAMKHLHQANLAELDGDIAEATRHYRRVQELWSGADGPARDVVAFARERIAWFGGQQP